MPSRQATEHEQMRWGYMTYVDLSRRITKMTKRDKLDAFLHYGFYVWSGQERPSRVSVSDARNLIMAAIARCRTLGFHDLTGMYTRRMEQFDSNPPTRTLVAETRTGRSGRWVQVGGRAPDYRETEQRVVDGQARLRVAVNVQVSAWNTATRPHFEVLLNPNMRHSLFATEDLRRPMITAMWEFFQGVALGSIHGAECRITRSEAADLMRRLRDTALYFGCNDLAMAIAHDVDRVREAVLQWQTNQRLEGERILQEAAQHARQRQGIRLIRFPKKKKEDTLDSLMEDDKAHQPTIDEILGLGEDEEW